MHSGTFPALICSPTRLSIVNPAFEVCASLDGHTLGDEVDNSPGCEGLGNEVPRRETKFQWLARLTRRTFVLHIPKFQVESWLIKIADSPQKTILMDLSWS
jgi:hypothetical protein